MDPVTVIGLVGAVANIAEATGSVVSLIKSFKDGERDLSSLANDLSAFNEALVGFQRVLRSKHTIHRISGPVIENVLAQSARLIDELETRLTEMLSSGYSVVRRTKWVQHKSGIAKLHRSLKEQHAMLHTFLSITLAETTMHMNQYPLFMLSAPEPRSEGVTNPTPTPGFTADPGFLLPPQQTLRPRRNSGGSMQSMESATDSTAPSSLARLSIGSSLLSPESVTSSGSQTGDTVSSESEAGQSSVQVVGHSVNKDDRVILTDMWVTRRSCRYDCRCQCHEQARDTKSQRRLGALRNRTMPCSDPKCQANIASTEQATQYTNLFRETLSQVMSSKSVRVRPDLKTFRMVPEGSDAMRHVKHGNLEKLKLCIESGEATIWDTAPDGWSLLHVRAAKVEEDNDCVLLTVLDGGVQQAARHC